MGKRVLSLLIVAGLLGGCEHRAGCITTVTTLSTDDFGNGLWLVEKKCNDASGNAGVLDKRKVEGVRKEGEQPAEAVER